MACFSVPLPSELGNLGRNTFRALGQQDFDFSLFKNNSVFGEKLKIQLRAELFNVLNHANFTNGGQPFTPFNSQGLPVPANTRLVGTSTTARQIHVKLIL